MGMKALPFFIESMSQKTFTRIEQLYVLSHDRSWGRGWDPVKPV